MVNSEKNWMADTKKILIISSHFLPDNVNGSYRPLNYLNEFSNMGIEADLVAFHYERDDKGEFKVYHAEPRPFYEDRYEDTRVIRAVRKPSWRSKFYDVSDRYRISRHLKILFRWLVGSFPDANHSVDGYRTMYHAVEQAVQHKSYDLVLAIFMPHYFLKICHHINRRYDIPYVIDFRDLWDNRLADPTYPFRRVDLIKNWLVRYHFRKWTKNASLLTITNHYWGRILEKQLDKKYKVVTNGFDGVLHKPKSKFEKFTIGFAGSLTEFQSTQLLMKGLQAYLNEYPSDDWEVLLLAPNPKQPEVNKLLKALPNHVKCLPKTNKEEALEFMRKCHVLWYPAFERIQGWCSAKLFDYIGSGTPILVAPGDKGIVEDLIDETQTGKVVYNAEGFEFQLKEYYNMWQTQNRMVLPGRKDDRILQYTWSNQAKEMGRIVLELCSK